MSSLPLGNATPLLARAAETLYIAGDRLIRRVFAWGVHRVMLSKYERGVHIPPHSASLMSGIFSLHWGNVCNNILIGSYITV